MSELVQFTPDNDEKETLEGILERTLEKVRAGDVADIAVAWIERGDGEPEMKAEYYGQRQFAALLGAIDMLKHDMLMGQAHD